MPQLPRSFLLLVAALAMLVTACTSADGATEETPPASSTNAPSTAAPTTTGVSQATSTAPPETDGTSTPPTTRQFNASDLNLGAGGNFVSLDDPVMIPASAATWLQGDDVVLGIVADDGTAHAFPIRQMAYHHIANTTIAGEPYVVTY